jgi:hypothetical protein
MLNVAQQLLLGFGILAIFFALTLISFAKSKDSWLAGFVFAIGMVCMGFGSGLGPLGEDSQAAFWFGFIVVAISAGFLIRDMLEDARYPLTPINQYSAFMVFAAFGFGAVGLYLVPAFFL